MLNEWPTLAPLLPDIAVKLGTAVLCGFLLGMEREHRNKPAGLRTITLITVGATVFMIVSKVLPAVAVGPEAITRVDPARIAAQVVSGVGFLGAGAIIQARGSVHGLTTAAVIWVAAGIGLTIGVGFPLLGLGVTLLTLLALVSMDPLASLLSRPDEKRTLKICLPDDQLTYQRVCYVVEQQNAAAKTVPISASGDGMIELEIQLGSDATSSQRLVEALSRIEGVSGKPCDPEGLPKGAGGDGESGRGERR